MLCLAGGRAAAQRPPAPREYEVKAAYLLNFTRYVEWPAVAFASPDSPLVIGVLGPNPFGPVLERTLAGRTVRGRRIELRLLEAAADVEGCHAVFMAWEEYRLDPALIERLARPGLLTVGEREEFVERGGVLGFVLVNQTVRFAVNRGAAERAGLRVSSRLLALATAIHERAPGTP